jgi:hypothetical protein
MGYRPDRGWGSPSISRAGAEPAVNAGELEDLRRRVAELETRLGTGDR